MLNLFALQIPFTRHWYSLVILFPCVFFAYIFLYILFRILIFTHTELQLIFAQNLIPYNLPNWVLNLRLDLWTRKSNRKKFPLICRARANDLNSFLRTACICRGREVKNFNKTIWHIGQLAKEQMHVCEYALYEFNESYRTDTCSVNGTLWVDVNDQINWTAV